MPVDFPLKPQHPQNMSPDIIRCPLRDDIPQLGNRWFACEQECPTFPTAGCSCFLVRGVDPAAATLPACSRWPGREGAYLPKGAPGTCVCSVFPTPTLSSMPAHPACKFPPFTPFLASGLSVSCSLHSWPALGEGQIFTAPRLTEDRTGAQKTGVSSQLTQTES